MMVVYDEVAEFTEKNWLDLMKKSSERTGWPIPPKTILSRAQEGVREGMTASFLDGVIKKNMPPRFSMHFINGRRERG